MYEDEAEEYEDEAEEYEDEAEEYEPVEYEPMMEDEATEDRLRREALGEDKARQEAELRDQYESLAEGLASDAGDQIRSFLETPNAPETGAIAAVFPAFARW